MWTLCKHQLRSIERIDIGDIVFRDRIGRFEGDDDRVFSDIETLFKGATNLRDLLELILIY